MSVGFHLKLTFGLKPEVGGIKIVHVSNCLQTIHFPSWVSHSHFDLRPDDSVGVFVYISIFFKVI